MKPYWRTIATELPEPFTLIWIKQHNKKEEGAPIRLLKVAPSRKCGFPALMGENRRHPLRLFPQTLWTEFVKPALPAQSNEAEG